MRLVKRIGRFSAKDGKIKEMKLIQLGGNRYKNSQIKGYVMVDDEDYDELSKFSWFLSSSGYAVRSNWHDGRKNGHTHMGRILLGCPSDKFIDHIDGDKLNNQKNNLRIVDKAQNGWNRGAPNTNRSGYRGVHFEKYTQKFRAEIIARGKRYRLGRFDTAISAAKAYNRKAKELYGAFARLNKLVKELP